MDVLRVGENRSAVGIPRTLSAALLSMPIAGS
jgi:hypothetical protein